MGEFIHCNFCYSIPERAADSKYFITTCGHIFCGPCVSTLNAACKICSKTCTAYEICKQLSSNIKNLFVDPMSLMKKYQRQFQQTMHFQDGQRRHYLEYSKKQTHAAAAKIRKIEENAIRDRAQLNLEIEKWQRDYQTVKTELEQLKQQRSFHSPFLDMETPARHRSTKRFRSGPSPLVQNGSMSVSSARSTNTVESLPLGASVSYFAEPETPNYCQNPAPIRGGRNGLLDLGNDSNAGTPAPLAANDTYHSETPRHVYNRRDPVVPRDMRPYNVQQPTTHRQMFNAPNPIVNRNAFNPTVAPKHRNTYAAVWQRDVSPATMVTNAQMPHLGRRSISKMLQR